MADRRRTQCPWCNTWFRGWHEFIAHAEDGCGQAFLDEFSADYARWHRAEHSAVPYPDCSLCFPDDPRWNR